MRSEGRQEGTVAQGEELQITMPLTKELRFDHLVHPQGGDLSKTYKLSTSV